jgi:hypothetical protein
MSVAELEAFRQGSKPSCVVKAPPGSGKTQLLVDAAPLWAKAKNSVIVTALTNEQVDDICERLGKANRRMTIVRFTSSTYTIGRELPDNVQIVRTPSALPKSYDILISTTAKLAIGGRFRVFDVMFVDEAWQVAFRDLLPLTRFAQRLVMIGDPGQIPPVQSVSHLRWDTAPFRPGEAMPEPFLRNAKLRRDTEVIELATCRRLPLDSVQLVNLFYDFPFAAEAQPHERFLRATPTRARDALDQALMSFADSSSAIVTIPTSQGIGIDTDLELAEAIANAAVRILKQTDAIRASAKEPKRGREILPQDIGICATHRAMNAAIRSSLPQRLLDSGIVVDTPERWQGQQRPVMIIAHPLSGIEHPSGFDLETGRLCVMASRHQSALLVMSRDHVKQTLDSHMPSATQSPGLPDAIGGGHAIHTRFWDYHVANRLFAHA